MKLVLLAAPKSLQLKAFLKIFSRGCILIGGGASEPKYEGYQIWVHGDIPDYTDLTKAAIQTKYPIINYVI